MFGVESSTGIRTASGTKDGSGLLSRLRMVGGSGVGSELGGDDNSDPFPTTLKLLPAPIKGISTNVSEMGDGSGDDDESSDAIMMLGSAITSASNGPNSSSRKEASSKTSWNDIALDSECTVQSRPLFSGPYLNLDEGTETVRVIFFSFISYI